jgi:hypothetical protein
LVGAEAVAVSARAQAPMAAGMKPMVLTPDFGAARC